MNGTLRIALPLVALAVLVATPALAQQSQPRNLPIPGVAQEPQVRFGVDGGFLLPLGDLADATGPAIGVLGRFEYPVALNATVTARAGYLHGLSESTGDFSFSVSHVPILGGFKFFPSQRPLQQGGLYLGAEFGPNLVIARASDSIASDSDSEFRFAFGLGAGFEVGMVDLRGGLFVADIGEFGDSMGLLFSAGLTF